MRIAAAVDLMRLVGVRGSGWTVGVWLAGLTLAGGLAAAGPSRSSSAGLETGEFLIDTMHQSAPGEAEEPAVGSDGTDFLAVWWDERGGLYATRVSASGAVLDPSGITVAGEGDGWRPAVAFDGTNYLVVYGCEGQIRARRVAADGAVLEPEIEVSNAGGSQENAKVAFDGTNYLIVWADWGSGEDVHGARVSPAGVVLDTACFLISDTLGVSAMPAVCALPSGFLVVWQNQWGNYNVFAARVSSAGAVLDPGGFPVAVRGEEFEPAVAFDGANALVAWTDYVDGNLHGARVTQAGQVLDTAGFLISDAARFQEFCEMAFDGTNYLLVWEDYRLIPDVGNVYAARVSPAAQVLDPDGIPVQADSFYDRVPALAVAGGTAVVVWQGWPPPDLETDVLMKRVSAAGRVLDSVALPLATYCPVQWDPAAAFDGTNYLVVWEDDRNTASETDIYAARITPAGQNLDPAGILICDAPDWQQYPAVAFDGVNYVVAWQDDRNDGQPDIYAARVTPAGVLLDTLGIAVAWEDRDDERYPTVAAGDTVCLIAWELERRDIEGRRIGRSGTVLDSDPIEISPDERGKAPAAAFDRSNFLIVFHDDRSDTVDVFGTFVGQDGSVGSAEFRISHGNTNEECNARAAFDGGNYLVAWETERPGNWEIHAARLTPAGVVLDSPSLAVSPTGRTESDADLDLAFDGADFVLIWEDSRLNPQETDICGARVNPGGQVREQFSAVRQPAGQYVPRLARGPGNQLLLVYEGWTTTYHGRVFNTDRIWGKLSPLAAVTEDRAAPEARLLPTIVRGVLWLPTASGRKPQAASLLDISGRKVLDLQPGPNDVSRLAPGVYFVFERAAAGGERAGSQVRKVVLQR